MTMNILINIKNGQEWQHRNIQHVVNTQDCLTKSELRTISQHLRVDREHLVETQYLL
jgi:hypothetical protein